MMDCRLRRLASGADCDQGERSGATREDDHSFRESDGWTLHSGGDTIELAAYCAQCDWLGAISDGDTCPPLTLNKWAGGWRAGPLCDPAS